MKKKLLVLGLIAVFSMGTMFRGELLQLTKTTALATCGATNVNSITAMLGGANETASKICICGSDGAAVPVYAWCSLTVANAAAMVCAGGSTTVCP